MDRNRYAPGKYVAGPDQPQYRSSPEYHERIERMQDEHENMRKQCWIAAFAGTASATNCTDRFTAVKYADYALEVFDRKFPKPTL